MYFMFFSATLKFNLPSDVDECVEYNNWCEQSCTNLVGNYSCSCGSDYSLAKDGRSCLGNNVCCLIIIIVLIINIIIIIILLLYFILF